MRRVVVTGLGAVTPIGNDRRSTWDAAVAGRSGIDFISSFDASGYPVRIAGEVKGFDPASVVGPKEARRLDRYVTLGVAAAIEAAADASLDGAYDPSRVGVLFGSAIGGIVGIAEQHSTLLERGPDRVSPYFIPSVLVDAASGQIAITLGLRGPELRARVRVRDRVDRDRRGGRGHPPRRGRRRARRRVGGCRDAADPGRFLRDARARRRGRVPAARVPSLRRHPRRLRDRRGRVRARARGARGRPGAGRDDLRRGARLRRVERRPPPRPARPGVGRRDRDDARRRSSGPASSRSASATSTRTAPRRRSATWRRRTRSRRSSATTRTSSRSPRRSR